MHTWIHPARFTAVALVLLAWFVPVGAAGLALWSVAALTVLGAAIIGRALFYVLVIPTTMPGAFFWKNPGFQNHARDVGLARMPQVGVQVTTH